MLFKISQWGMGNIGPISSDGGCTDLIDIDLSHNSLVGRISLVGLRVQMGVLYRRNFEYYPKDVR